MGVFIIFVLCMICFVPVFFARFYIKARGVAMDARHLLVFIAAGVLSLILALVAQTLLPGLMDTFLPQYGTSRSVRSSLSYLFLRVALPEEGARLIIMIITFSLIQKFSKEKMSEGFACAAGLIAGLAFAALESADYALRDAANLNWGYAWLRLLSVPLHASCGMRCALAARGFFSRGVGKMGGGKMLGGGAGKIRHFATALVIHVFFNFILMMGGWRAALGILLSLSTLVSAALLIRPRGGDADEFNFKNQN
jgi:RsiW-degrading membrane proteinase PrsW (M82 family)